MTVDLQPVEIEVLKALPDLLESVGSDDPAAARLEYVAHPDDAEADAGFHELVDAELDHDRTADRTSFEATLESREISLEEAGAWMRVIGEARLVMASRIGIEDDGWEESIDEDADPRVAVLHVLGHLQDSLVGELTAAL